MIVMFGFIITASEFYYRIRNMQFLWTAKTTSDLSRRIRDCIPDKVYENLPSITWNVCIILKKIFTKLANLIKSISIFFFF